MMPVVAGEASTRRLILAYAALLVPISIAPAFTVAGGPLYLAVALVANAAFILGALQVARRDAGAARADGYQAEKKLFGVSIVYLFALFAAFILDAGLKAATGLAWPVWF